MTILQRAPGTTGTRPDPASAAAALGTLPGPRPGSRPPAPAPAPGNATCGFEAARFQVDRCLDDLLAREAERWCRLDRSLELGFDLLRDFIAAGGKRLRPAFCWWGFVGGGGDRDDPRIVDLCAAVEMLHTFALVHDDVMDGSDTRRSSPTVHRSVAGCHAEQGWRGEERRVSEAVAVLLGDLAFVYADQLLRQQPAPVMALFDEMRVELHVGQYLDLMAAASPEPDQGRAETVLRYKTAKYSVERPLHLGAALAGSLPQLEQGLSGYGLAVGEAFQLRDDLLGAFGDPAVTGKPRGDDFREGKQTLLVHLARRWCGERGRSAAAAVLARLGQPDLTPEEVDAICDILERSDARTCVEQRIDDLMARAGDELRALDLEEPARQALHELGRQAAWRVT
jgi:geranylgeranyl diphosphate synthase type I